jgi:diguanylate cyclase (GGDEF)-like protein
MAAMSEGPRSKDGARPSGAAGLKRSPQSGTLRLDADVLQRYIQNQSQRGSLLVIAGTHADIGTHLVIEDVVLIGREGEGLQLRDSGMSRCHASVTHREGTYAIRDMGSTNGTLVNGVRLEGERNLLEGDKIFLGQTIIKFTMVDETEAVYLKQVAALVGTDDLTGLMSKHRFDAALKECVRTAVALGTPLTALMMDMDGLKAVNDQHGHHAGAETIRQVGGLIGRTLGERGEACRFGGDEFSAYLTNTAKEDGTHLAQLIRQGVETARIEWAGAPLVVTISIGVAALGPGANDPVSLLHQADQALYRAKARGKNCVSD